MKTDFEIKKIQEKLTELLNLGVIKNYDDLKKLKDIYIKDYKSCEDIIKEINNLKFDKEKLNELLMKNEKIGDINISELDVKKKEECKLSLENITDFEKDGKQYIKIHYPYPNDNVRIIENRSDPYQTGKERFEELKERFAKSTLDGIENATSIFEQSLSKDCIELNIKDIKEVSSKYEFDKLTKEEQQIVYGTLKAIILTLPVSEEEKRILTSKSVDTILDNLQKKVCISPADNIVVISQINETTKDEIKSLNVQKRTNINGEIVYDYYLKPLNETGYNYEKSNVEEDQVQESIENNNEYEKQNIDDLDKEVGSSLTYKAPWQKRKRNNAAFISILWFVMFLGMILSVLLVTLVKVYIS